VTSEAADREWLRAQVATYRTRLPRYARYGKVLQELLETAAREIAPLAIVTHRPKSISSFAEKALRKRAKYDDPVNQLTDLCGARVMVRTRSEADRFCRWVEENLEVDRENSDVASERLGTTEFGYRGVHYVVTLKPGAAPKPLLGLKAELQVRTTLEHAWADFAHDLSYKGAFELPERWVRALAVAAAELEDIDGDFSRVEDGMRAYATTYGSYLGEERLAEELATLEAVLEYDSENAELAWRIGKLAMRLGDWPKAVEVMSPFVDPRKPDSAFQPLLRDLGVSLCGLHRAKPKRPAYRRGQRYLAAACHPKHADPDALASHAGTWRGVDDAKAHDLYRQAFELDPTGYYGLANYLEYELRQAKSTALLAPLRPTIAAAMERARSHAEVGVNFPWALAGQAKLHLLLNEPNEALRAYARTVSASTAAFMVETTLRSVERLAVVRDELQGYEWARTMLRLGLAAKFRSPGARRRLRRLAANTAIEGPVVIVVGGTHPDVEERMRQYRDLVLHAFRDFQGTIVCGGTREGVSGLVGEVAATHPKRIRTVAYVPRKLPGDATLDRRYRDLRRTDADRFTPLEPLQAWVDLVASGIEPADVKVLGINGGDIAALEFRVALALGALVGVVEESGRAATRLLADEAWAVSERLVPLPEDGETVRAFIGSGRSRLEPRKRETIGKLIHEEYRKEQASTYPSWSSLEEGLRESNRHQADDIFAKLEEIGCGVREVKDRPIVLMTFTPAEIERLSEMEHGRFNAERLAAGWRWGPEKDRARRISSSLVPWAELSEAERELDRATVLRIPKYLEAVGLEIYREDGRGQTSV
jgi:ppGpp synthetase/RelA/SpoT-type nucleotidyltranferase